MEKQSFIGLVRNRTPEVQSTRLSAVRVMAATFQEAVQQIRLTAGYPVELYYITQGSDIKRAINTYHSRWS